MRVRNKDTYLQCLFVIVFGNDFKLAFLFDISTSTYLDQINTKLSNLAQSKLVLRFFFVTKPNPQAKQMVLFLT